MRRHFLLTTALVLVTLTAAVRADGPDTKGLVGTWTITKGEKGGAVEAKADSKGEFRFRDGAVKIASGDQEAEYSYALRPSKAPSEKPSEIDFRTNAPKGAAGVVLSGIYRLDGDDLVIALSLAPFARPTEFKTAKDTSVMMFTLKRKK